MHFYPTCEDSYEPDDWSVQSKAPEQAFIILFVVTGLEVMLIENL
jgi:hypothetical protein